ncbi:ribonuclease H1 domain-containing protein [Romboutsia sp. 1001713B170207_170306_H8]|uniref:ribonuclease H1 domain-containing protein n=1 Tax=Romboutsia sp. 1001713B170207_170306_H8 TaxID=2787112 RepID=UPI0018987C39|nr:ribonuclease H family protein [Romboutsia sp. 1001713B170207_170306_H8]
MAKKVYAIKEGFDSLNNKRIQNELVYTWNDCLKYVKGVKGAIYKSFESIEEANKFLSEGSKLLRKNRDTYPLDCLHMYVDGSYSTATGKYSYGVVGVRENIVEYIESGSGKNKGENNIRQIAGELQGAVKAVEYALKKGDTKIVLFHDYEGICHHATGFWQRKDESSEKYYLKMQELIKKGIEVIFVQVNSHQGDLFNELVDSICKQCLGIENEKVIEKWLSKDTILVANEKVKDEITQIITKGEENIIVVNKNEINETSVSYKNNDLNLEIMNILKLLSNDKKRDVLEYIKNLI